MGASPPGLRAIALVPARTLADAGQDDGPGEPVPVAFTPAVSRPGERDPHPVEGMISFECRGRAADRPPDRGEFIRYQSRFPDGVRLPRRGAGGPVHRGRPAGVPGRRPGQPGPAHLRPGQVVVEAQTEGRARAAEAVAASFEGDEPAIAFNPHYLLDGLTAAAAGSGPARPSADPEAAPAPATATIRLEFTSPAKSALITLAGDGGEGPGERTGEARPGSR